ncbi:sulfite exporter TauE/SafE family protein [Marinomonas sp. IMCC 4694]|uniref:sulfite exporter TauE/SafE family protein n=1 Tax=Marinomonas sp. IMCC 4694 TaxID=2605432 RepID=UPI0011E69A95|nr:sulfite exporter TauE/SafE family protein [Marinomonas sp. IMCC 4694]TYL46573.1 sulfite exporter TauE/SafE family protein [Marinomonas sp. IMCC 4694]
MDSAWVVLFLAGLITGFSKFSVGGMGLLILPILMIAYPGPEALAILLPLYIVTDIMAVFSYKAKVAWSVLARFLPFAFLGVYVASHFLASIDADQFVRFLGVMILFMILLGLYLDYRPTPFMRKPWAAYSMGFFGGIVTMMANAAGPLFSLFLLEQKLDKNTYVSTRAWAFFIINVVKLPFYLSLGLLSLETTQASVYTLPGLFVGSFIGYHFLKRVNPVQFKWLIRIMSMIAAVKLFIFS